MVVASYRPTSCDSVNVGSLRTQLGDRDVRVRLEFVSEREAKTIVKGQVRIGSEGDGDRVSTPLSDECQGHHGAQQGKHK